MPLLKKILRHYDSGARAGGEEAGDCMTHAVLSRGTPTFEKSASAQARLHELVPGGAHTDARGSGQYPEDMTPVLVRGHGTRVIEAAGGALEVYTRADEAGSHRWSARRKAGHACNTRVCQAPPTVAGRHHRKERRIMKVVLFCGGLGMRMRTGIDAPVPKPMMPIGTRPVLWHIMRYYAHFGHNEFILCLGFGAHAVKDYFLDYHETHSNDFVLSNAGRTVELLSSDISDWRITFADTGFETPIGERLRRVRDYLGDDEVFLANYGDVLTDAPMNDLIDAFLQTDAVGSLLAVPPQDSFHVVRIDGDSRLTGIEPVADMDMRINGGYFVLRREIFDYLQPG